MAFSVEYYETEDGQRPAEEFILAQDFKMQAKLFMMLEFLEEKGPALREPYSKSLEDGMNIPLRQSRLIWQNRATESGV